MNFKYCICSGIGFSLNLSLILSLILSLFTFKPDRMTYVNLPYLKQNKLSYCSKNE